MKLFAIALGLLAATSAMASPQGDGWSYDIKPPPSEQVFKTPYDLLLYTNQGVSSGDPQTVTITSDGNGAVTVDILYPLTAESNPVIALMQDNYTLKGDDVRGWKVANVRARWKCRFGNTQDWHSQRNSCLAKAVYQEIIR